MVHNVLHWRRGGFACACSRLLAEVLQEPIGFLPAVLLAPRCVGTSPGRSVRVPWLAAMPDDGIAHVPALRPNGGPRGLPVTAPLSRDTRNPPVGVPGRLCCLDTWTRASGS
ncbi:hypothetical protein NDU88_010425 [Pleurodeles waltl]|uniref:Uncharacterized protein n=1 Tax=Pleurodeles waltl TaxID=8319 RepID=A0AAV7R081_PLEWA|nr:hypothetical protein NDU88_010425 [Pleurodeles waltl]